jgi:predicted NBD/HSP70 family sugar kinase
MELIPAKMYSGKATQQSLKEHNRNLALRMIFEKDKISRAEIARQTGLTPTTVSDIVSELMNEGLVDEIGIGRSTGGKNPILLSLLPDSRFSIGLDLANDRFSGAIVNLRGEIKEYVSYALNDLDGEAALNLVFKILDYLLDVVDGPIFGIGIGAPGLIDPIDGVVITAVNFNWKNLHLGKIIEERYRLPVQIINDCQAAAIAEKTYVDRNRNVNNMIVINVRHGIGAGIIINGEIFHGDGGSAGEVGHIVVVPDGGDLCRCGNYGCLETVASAQAILRKAEQIAKSQPQSALNVKGRKPSLSIVQSALTQGDKYATKLVLDSGYYLGMAISWLVGIFNIQKIILTGDMTSFGEPWLRQIKETMKEMSLERPLSNTEVEIGQVGENSVIIGASASLVNDTALIFTQ